MTLRESQNKFVQELGEFEIWADKFNLIIENSGFQSKDIPEDLLSFRITNCQSRTYFKAENTNGYTCISGWSNSSIMAGLIVYIKRIFNCMPIEELATTPINFHTDSGLVENVTPMRKAAILEIVNRINALKR